MKRNHSFIKLYEKVKGQPPSKSIFLVIVCLLLGITVASTIVLANENRVIVRASVLNVRMGPGLSHEIMTQVQAEDQLNILGEENQWYKVRLSNDEIGWVASWLVENEEVTRETHAFGRITADSVNLRQFFTTDSDVVATVYQGTELEILYEENEWYQVYYMGRVAWVSADYFEAIEVDTQEQINGVGREVVIGEESINIRLDASLDADVLDVGYPGQRFRLIRSVGQWYEIEVDHSVTGYVANWVVSVEEASEEVVTEERQETQNQDARAATQLSEAIIVIDPGHGGQDPGAVSRLGFTEAELALSTSLLLEQRLQDAGANVIMTRSDDYFVTLTDRVVITEEANADAFISVHYDSSEEPNQASGTTTYYFSETERELADSINHYLDIQGPLPNRGVRQANFSVLRNNSRPSILLELGYMNHDHDLTMINTHEYQSTVVEAIYQGLREYYAD